MVPRDVTDVTPPRPRTVSLEMELSAVKWRQIMNYRKGTIVSVHQHGGCVEVTVDGDRPGAFVIDNCCMWAIVDREGSAWIGRKVEYDNGLLRFLEGVEAPSPYSQEARPA